MSDELATSYSDFPFSVFWNMGHHICGKEWVQLQNPLDDNEEKTMRLWFLDETNISSELTNQIS